MQTFLHPPFLPSESAATAARALSLSHPVWLAGGPGAGAYLVARALHFEGDPTGFVSVRRILSDAGELEHRVRATLDTDPEAGLPGLYVERIERQPAAVQELCLRWIDEGLRHGGRTIAVRVLAQSDATDASRVQGLLRALAQRLSPLVIRLPSLDERRADALGIARCLAAEAAGRLGRSARRPSDATLTRLAAETATVEELQSAIERAILAGETEHPPTGKSRAASVDAVSASSPQAPEPPYGLEALVAELAHELKNPMVTIKTFAQHLDQLSSDAELRERFSKLATEAIDRMDGFLDELLHFSRFGPPNPHSVVVSELLARSLGRLDPRLRDQVSLNGLPSGGRVRADEEQLGFAFRALVRGLARELPTGSGIVLESGGPGEVIFRAKGAAGSGKLQSLLHPDNGSEVETSLHFALALSLIHRNGGNCRIVRGAEALEARLVLPTPESK